MPHTRTPPSTVEEILATSEADPEWTEVLKKNPWPNAADFDLETLKEVTATSRPRFRAALDASRPADVVEVDVEIEIPSTDLKVESATNKAIVTYPKSNSADTKWPIIILFHGGGHTLGYPEQEVSLARVLVQKHQAVVICPSYRLAPEHTFPTSYNDGFETLKQIAVDSMILSEAGPDQQAVKVLPTALAGKIDPRQGFIVGGTSAGAMIAASISHMYHKWRQSLAVSPTPPPPLTGIFFAAGSTVNPGNVPAAYKEWHHARKQNAEYPPLDKYLVAIFRKADKADWNSPIMASLDQHPELGREKVGEDHLYLKEHGTRVYVQACGQDVSRDDALIYEHVLREEVGVETRLDLYSGFGHCFWALPGPYAELKLSKQRVTDTVEGFDWLLHR